jgi:secondary thiamine-phosphate synthase enzyme
MDTIKVKSSRRSELIEVTEQVEEIVVKNKVNEGACLIFVPHTTAGILINENCDPSVKEDILKRLNDLAPLSLNAYTHVEGNSDAHIKSSLVGTTLSVFINRNKIVLGKWQGIFFAEFDGPREREIFVNVISQ